MPVPPILETERLVLRPLTMDDAPAITHSMNDREIVRFFPRGLPFPYPIEKAREFIANANDPQTQGLYWAVTLKGDDTLIGIADLRPHVTDNGQRGFWIAREHQNKGYMTETLHVLNDYWFDTLGKDILLMRNAQGNVASNRLKEKTGARLREAVQGNYADPSMGDSQLWEMTRNEWQNYKVGKKK